MLFLSLDRDLPDVIRHMIHMLTIDRAISIVFLDNDLPSRGINHTHPLCISVGCLGHKVPFILLDNGSTLNVCPLATTITLGFRPFYFQTSTHTMRAYDST